MPSLQNLQRYVAATSVGPTTLRNMRGTAGKLDCARQILADVDLSDLIKCDFPNFLDDLTDKLRKAFEIQPNCWNWGAARKAANLFLRESAYNYRLREQFQFSEIEHLFECPLDSFSMKGIRDDASVSKKWSGPKTIPSVSELSKIDSEVFQARALEIAKSSGTFRVHLDIGYWLSSKKFDDAHD
jgi:hypothetical protein